MTDFVFSSPQKSLFSEFGSREFQFLKVPQARVPFLSVRAIFIWWCIAY